jgi:DNA polymerase-1
VRDYIARNLEFGRENGYVETLLGRRRYFPDLRARNYAMRSAAEREATNAPMQGSAADLMKLAMVRVERALREGGFDALLLLQIHDELILEIERSQLDPIARLLKHEMEHAIALSVPLDVTIKTGASWYDVESLTLDDVA